jgi:type IV secretion system protein VirD4
LLMMLDEFPALGRLDFFETSLAFMAGYGIRAFLIAQSLNQISKAYGENNAILDNCHVRVCFSTNDERTAKRVSDALGTATEQRAMRNYAGHRLSPWLGHVMVSRQETARPLLTPGEVMQLPATDEIVMISGLAPIRAKKLRYYEDGNFAGRVLSSPRLGSAGYRDCPPARGDDWAEIVAHTDVRLGAKADEDTEKQDGGLQQAKEPDLPGVDKPKKPEPAQLELLSLDDDGADPAADQRNMDRVRNLAVVTNAHAINESSDRDDLLPSF